MAVQALSHGVMLQSQKLSSIKMDGKVLNGPQALPKTPAEDIPSS